MNIPPPPPPDDSGTPPPPPGFGQPAAGPPPPPGFGQPAAGPQPPPGFGQPAAGGPPYSEPAYGAVPPSYGPGPAPGFEQQPPRPDAKVGASLIVAGAVIALIGVYLPWLNDRGDSRNGTDLFFTSDGQVVDGPGNLMLALAVVIAGLGIALFFAGRVLAVAIIAIVASSIAVLFGLGMIGITSDDILGGDLGVGVILQPIASIGALVGSILVTAKRRR